MGVSTMGDSPSQPTDRGPGGEERSEDLTVGERALAEATYGTTYEDMDEWKQDQFDRLLEDMPEHLRAGLSGKLLTKGQLADGMEDVFTSMTEDDDIPKEWKDGAAVFAKGLHKKFGIDGGGDA